MASSPAAAVERDEDDDVVTLSSSISSGEENRKMISLHEPVGEPSDEEEEEEEEVEKLISPPEKARFQLCCFHISHNTDFKLGNLFGYFAATGIPGKLQLMSIDPSLDYDVLFCHEHWANEGLYRSHYFYPNYSCSIPASTYVEILSKLYLAVKDEHKYIEVSHESYGIDFKKIWRDKDYEGWDSETLDGEYGSIQLYYYAIRSAVNAVLEISFEGDSRFSENDDFMVRIYAYYADDVKISTHHQKKHCYKIKVFEAGSFLSYSKIKQGKLELMQSVVAVPDHSSLIIDSYIFDCSSENIVLDRAHKFPAQLTECTNKARVEGVGNCSFTIKVDWKPL